MNQKQYGASLGGPLVRNRTFYFANVEQKRLDQTGIVTISQGDADAINARLAAVGYPGARVATGHLCEPGDVRRISWQDRSSDRRVGSIRHPVQPVQCQRRRTRAAPAGPNAPSAAADLDNVDHSVALSNTLTLSPRTVNETRFQFASGDLKAPPTDPIGPAVSIAGVAVVRHVVREPDAPREPDGSGRGQHFASGGRTRASSRRRFSVQQRSHHVSAIESRSHTRSRRSRISLPARTTTPDSLRPSASSESLRRIPTWGSTRRTNGRSVPA